MEFKKLFAWFILAFLGVAAVFSFGMPGNSASDKVQAYEIGIEKNGIESSSKMITKGQPANPLEFLTAGAEEIAGDTEVTVYNQNLALVKEKRELDLKSGVNSIEYTDVASQIDPTSVMVEDPKNKNTVVLEQNYEYDLVSSSKLLDKYLDKEITVTDKEGTAYTGKLLSHDDGVVLQKKEGGVVTLTEISKVEFPDAAGLLTKPTLVWQIYSPASGKRDLLTSYLTGGMSWRADYVVKASADDTKADITGWVSIDNKAGTTYENAKLKLVAGDVHRVYAPQPIAYDEAVQEKGAGATSRAFAEEALFEYHLYTLERPATLKNNQVKQLSLLTADAVPIKKELVFDSQKGEKVQVVLNMKNSKDKGLGMPLPKGLVRVYKADSDGQLQFLGEDQIDHTPKDEEIKVTVGNAFDVTGKRTQKSYERISDKVQRTSFEIELKNHKSEAQEIKIVEHLYGDWEILKNSDPYEKTDAYTVEFKVKVPANGTKTVSYTVEYRY